MHVKRSVYFVYKDFGKKSLFCKKAIFSKFILDILLNNGTNTHSMDKPIAQGAEAKIYLTDSKIIKDRIKLEASDCCNKNLDIKLNQLFKNNEDNQFLNELIWFKKRNLMKPKLYISYDRSALVSKVDKKFRIT